MDVRLGLTILATAGVTALVARWWWPDGLDDKGSRLADFATIPIVVGVVAARLATVLIEHPAGIVSLREIAIVRGGTEFWIGVAAGSAAVGLTVRYTHRIVPRLALIAPFGLIAYGLYQAGCVIQDGCPGPPSPFGLVQKGIDQRVLPVGLAEGVVAILLGYWFMKRPPASTPMIRLATLLAVLFVIRTVASLLKPTLGAIPSRDQIFGLLAGATAIVLWLYARTDGRRWPVSKNREGGGGVHPQ